MKPTKSAGMLMLAGAALILVTICFEYQIGWIGVERDRAEAPGFILEQWSALKLIWSFQMLGHGLLAVAYLLLCTKGATVYTPVWAALCLLAFLVITAFGLTLGGYEPALVVYETQPAIFDSLSGSIRGLYTPGGLGGILLFTLLFVTDTARQNGVVDRLIGSVTLAFFLVCLVIGATTSLTVKVMGASWFFLPMVMGYSLMKHR